jgi:hypothetical protein
MLHTFDFIEEPRGDLLHCLINAAARLSDSVMIVLRDDLGLNEKGRALLSRLEPSLLERQRRASWPGTTLVDGEATTLRFALNAEVVGEILAASNGLFEWQQPALPEDLSLLRSDGTAVLASIAHERDAYLEVSDAEYRSLVEEVPELAGVVRPHDRQTAR